MAFFLHRTTPGLDQNYLRTVQWTHLDGSSYIWTISWVWFWVPGIYTWLPFAHLIYIHRTLLNVPPTISQGGSLWFSDADHLERSSISFASLFNLERRYGCHDFIIPLPQSQIKSPISILPQLGRIHRKPCPSSGNLNGYEFQYLLLI